MLNINVFRNHLPSKLDESLEKSTKSIDKISLETLRGVIVLMSLSYITMYLFSEIDDFTNTLRRSSDSKLVKLVSGIFSLSIPFEKSTWSLRMTVSITFEGSRSSKEASLENGRHIAAWFKSLSYKSTYSNISVCRRIGLSSSSETKA